MNLIPQLYKEGCCNFWDIYCYTISPKLKKIDILMKSGKNIFSLKDVSKILNVDEKDIRNFMKENQILKLDKKCFFKLMIEYDSYLSGIILREFYNQCDECYSPEDIAYIYGLEFSSVKKAFEFLSIDKIKPKYFSAIFLQIYI